MNLHVINFIKENEDWRDKLSQAPYCLTIREDDNFVLLKYDQIESDFHESIVRECRGLIIDKNTLEPVALSFYKFFNVQEPLADRIYWKDCRVQEKVDGSKMLVWYDKYKEDWRVSTSSLLDAKDAEVRDFNKTFYNIFIEALKNNGLEDFSNLTFYMNKDYCYTFELVSPESRVVVPYKQADLYFIGCRYIPSFEECNPDEHVISEIIKRPKEYKLNSLNACLHATEKMGFDEEGFVVVDKYWNRIKVKSPAYVAAAHARDNGVVNRDKILTIIEQGETDEFLGYFPEYKEYFDDLQNKRQHFFDNLIDAVKDVDNILKADDITDTWTRKDYAQYILKHHNALSSFLFKFMDTDLIKMFVETQWNKLSNDKKIEYLDRW